MKTSMALALAAVMLGSLSAAADPPPVEVQVLQPQPALVEAPSAPPMTPPVNPFPPALPAYAPSAPPFSPPPAQPEKRKLFHGRLRQRVRDLLHLGNGS